MERLAALWERFWDIQDNFDGNVLLEYTKPHTEIPALAVAFYLVFIFQVPHMLKTPFDLRIPCALWNISLAIFSTIGAFVCIPVLVSHVIEFGFINSICSPPEWYGLGRSGFWVALFVFSKIPELIDTVFLVLQKKKVIFLHWFHHVTVLVYCWHAYNTRIGAGIWFASMNYFVHSIMYSYYFLGLIGMRKLVKPIAPIVTTLQLVQMIVGIVITGTTFYKINVLNESCYVDPTNMKLALAMYFSYFVLFAILFHNLYLLPKDSKGKSKPVNPGCPDIATRYNVTDGSGFFHDEKTGSKKKD